MKRVKGDVLESGAQLIAHQVNCQGVMGSGVALQIRKRYPNTYKAYLNYCGQDYPRGRPLGRTMFTVEEYRGQKFYIASMFAQDRYGYDGRTYTDYGAFEKCLLEVENFCRVHAVHEIAMPYKIGCGRGGGDWRTVSKLIQNALRDFSVTLFEFNG